MRMDDDTSPVYARVWQMQGGDLDDPGFAETYCAEVVPRLNDLPGLVGLSVLLDRGRKALDGPKADVLAQLRAARTPEVEG